MSATLTPALAKSSLGEPKSHIFRKTYPLTSSLQPTLVRPSSLCSYLGYHRRYQQQASSRRSAPGSWIWPTGCSSRRTQSTSTHGTVEHLRTCSYLGCVQRQTRPGSSPRRWYPSRPICQKRWYSPGCSTRARICSPSCTFVPGCKHSSSPF